MNIKKIITAKKAALRPNINQALLRHVSKQEPSDVPYMLFDLDVAIQNCKKFKKALPNVQLFYAVKAFYSRELVESLHEHVDGFDVASLKEIEDLVEYGVKAETINFSNPVKSELHIKRAYQLGVRKFAFQSLAELTKIKKNAPDAAVIARVRTEELWSFVSLSDKFGCTKSEAVKLLKYARSLGLKLGGVTFHVGSQLIDDDGWRRSIRLAHEIREELRMQNHEIEIINIGGGFPTRYFEDDPTITSVASHINKYLKNEPGLQYEAEPGRFIVADAAVIVSRVIGVEKRKEKNWLFIDTGLFQSFLGAMRYEVFPYHPISLFHQRKDVGLNRKSTSYILTGPSCDSQDIISRDTVLPNDLALGDVLVFPNTGAYTLAYGSDFNGFKVPEVRYIKDGKLL